MKTSARRLAGFTLGFALGLAHATVSNLINKIYLPGVPLYVPPPGTSGLILLTALFFSVLGLIAVWTDEAISGVILSAFIGSVVSSGWIMLTGTSDRASTFVLLFLVFMPRIFFYLPLSLGVRWIVSTFEPSPYRAAMPLARRIVPLAIAVLIAALSGTFSLENRETRQSLAKMDELVRLGMQAESRGQLPQSLQSVDGFVSKADGGYVFHLGSNPDVLPVQRPAVKLGTIEPFIIVVFDNGFRFGCVFSPPYEVPACIDL
ncbi:MAG: hypothetical protein HUU11_09940 [Anaerolineales bacterium]|nr:hypothetical protein [Anaerolineales bacterium]